MVAQKFQNKVILKYIYNSIFNDTLKKGLVCLSIVKLICSFTEKSTVGVLV